MNLENDDNKYETQNENFTKKKSSKIHTVYFNQGFDHYIHPYSYSFEIKENKKNNILKKILIIILILAISIFAFTTAIYDLVTTTPHENIIETEDESIKLNLNEKPVFEEKTRDSSGRYTTVGIAEVVSPSIVEILTFDENENSPKGNGSGIILDSEGIIITNSHVIVGSSTIKVKLLSTLNTYDAEIIGRDSKTDLAVIKISAEERLTPAELGNSDYVQLGEQVMAIGNPGGLSGSITGGYVSGLNRMIKTDSTGYEMNCIQTDAAISPGNSGGALVNMYGQIIGITSSKYVNSSFEGLGFAITINEAKPIIEELIENGHISGRFKIGISFIETELFSTEEDPLPEGIIIDKITEDADIAKSSLKAGDIITKIEDTSIYDYDSLMYALKKYEFKANDTVNATVIRINDDNTQNEFKIKFKLMPDTSGDY